MNGRELLRLVERCNYTAAILKPILFTGFIIWLMIQIYLDALVAWRLWP